MAVARVIVGEIQTMSRVTRILGRLSLTLTICASLSACAASLQQISPEQRVALETEKKALVLFRLTANLYRETIAPLNNEGDIPIEFVLANLDTGEPAQEITINTSNALFRLSSDSANAGWGSLVLPPGTYYFAVRSPKKWYRTASPSITELQFRFTVRPAQTALYIGSLRLDCIDSYTATLFGQKKGPPRCVSNATVFDESADAAIIFRNSDGTAVPVTTLMEAYFNPLSTGQLASLSPVGVLVSGGAESDVQSPEWMERAMQRGLRYGLAPSALLLAILGGGGGGGGAGAGAVLGLAILWAPVGATLGGLGGYVGGKWSESRFEPCRKSLRDSLGEFAPDAVLRQKLTAEMGEGGIPLTEVNLTEESGADDVTEVQLGSIVDARIHRIALRHCQVESQNLCVDVAVRTRVIETKSNKTIYDAVLFYGHSEVQPYELRAYSSESTPGHEVDTMCGQNGIETFHGEIARALDAIVERLVGDFGLRNE